jgi:hypothetical protein
MLARNLINIINIILAGISVIIGIILYIGTGIGVISLCILSIPQCLHSYFYDHYYMKYYYPLHYYCKNGDTEAVKKYVENNNMWLFNLHSKDKLNQTSAIKYAFINGHYDLVRYLDTVDIIGYNDDLYLHWACESGNYDLIRFVVNKGDIVKMFLLDSTTPIYYLDEKIERVLLFNEIYLKSKAFQDPSCESRRHYKGIKLMLQTELSCALYDNYTKKDFNTEDFGTEDKGTSTEDLDKCGGKYDSCGELPVDINKWKDLHKSYDSDDIEDGISLV